MSVICALHCFRVSKDLRIPDTRVLATVVAHEHHVLGSLVLSIVVSNTAPVLAGSALRHLYVELGRVGASGGRRGGSGGGVGVGSASGSSSGGRSIGLGAVVPNLFPRNNISVDGGGDPFGALLLLGLVHVLVAVMSASLLLGFGDFTLPLVVVGKIVNSSLLELDGTANVNGQLRCGVSDRRMCKSCKSATAREAVPKC